MTTTTMPMTLHDPAPLFVSLREQIVLIGLGRMWVYLTLAMLLLLAMAAQLAGSDVPVILGVSTLTPVAGAVWAIMVWHGPAAGRAYQWSLPVARAGHDLMRVLAGAVFLLGMLAVLVAAGAIASARMGTTAAFVAIPLEGWGNIIFGPLIAYLLVTPPMLWRDHAVTRWFFIVLMAVGVIAPFTADEPAFEVPRRILYFVFAEDRFGLSNALVGGIFTAAGNSNGMAWWPAAAVWLAFGIITTVFAATFRPDDLRKTLALRRSTL